MINISDANWSKPNYISKTALFQHLNVNKVKILLSINPFLKKDL